MSNPHSLRNQRARATSPLLVVIQVLALAMLVFAFAVSGGGSYFAETNSCASRAAWLLGDCDWRSADDESLENARVRQASR